MNELETLILKEKLKDKPNYDYIRWLQQLTQEHFSMLKNKSNNNLRIQK